MYKRVTGMGKGMGNWGRRETRVGAERQIKRGRGMGVGGTEGAHTRRKGKGLLRYKERWIDGREKPTKKRQMCPMTLLSSEHC